MSSNQRIINGTGLTLFDLYFAAAIAGVDRDSLSYGTVTSPRNPWPDEMADCARAAIAALEIRNKIVAELEAQR